CASSARSPHGASWALVPRPPGSDPGHRGEPGVDALGRSSRVHRGALEGIDPPAGLEAVAELLFRDTARPEFPRLQVAEAQEEEARGGPCRRLEALHIA